jgi:beta-lactam-binding protein with PASTA domain
MGFLKFIFSKRFLKHIIAAIIVSVLLIIGLFYWLNYYTNHDEYIEVPDLSKFTVDIVEKKTEELNLRFEISDSTAYNPEYPAYSVIDQNPKPGQLVKENRKIYLTINPQDYAMITIPDNVIGNTIRQVKPTLVSLGFRIGEITKKPYLAEGEVLELKHRGEEITPGSKLKKTSIIDIVIGDGSLDYGEEAPIENDNNSAFDGSGTEDNSSENLNSNK